jgi:hypothetical protein
MLIPPGMMTGPAHITEESPVKAELLISSNYFFDATRQDGVVTKAFRFGDNDLGGEIGRFFTSRFFSAPLHHRR